MKICISEIHLGRYRIDLLDENNQIINGTDGGSALIMCWLTDMIFKREHAQYLADQRRSSDDLGAAAIGRAYAGLSDSSRAALEELNRKRDAAKANRATKLIQEIKSDR